MQELSDDKQSSRVDSDSPASFNSKLSPELEARRNDISSRFEKVIDGLGLGIDSEILETVINFNVSGFHTSASCGGHLEEGRNGSPYIAISAPYEKTYGNGDISLNEPLFTYKGAEETAVKLLASQGLSLEDYCTIDWRKTHDPELYMLINILQDSNRLNSSHPHSEDFAVWSLECRQLMEKMALKLHEFYSLDKRNDETRLVIHGSWGRGFQVVPSNSFFVTGNHEVSEPSLQEWRKEFQAFGDYLLLSSEDDSI